MDIPTLDSPVTRSARFRTPNPFERACGLWVDRIGRSREATWREEGLRILGLYALVAVEDGCGVLVSRRHGRYVVRSGDVVVIVPDDATAYGPEAGAWSQRWVVWGGPAALTIGRLAELAGRTPVVAGAAHAVTAAYAQLRERMTDESVEAALVRDAVIRKLVADVLAFARSADCSDAHEGALRRIQALMDREFTKPMTSAMLARQSGVSETHFRRLFLARFGVSPQAYVVARRIACAKALLADGLSIREAAEASGYSDVFYFMRAFKRATGLTPGGWRRGANLSAIGG